MPAHLHGFEVSNQPHGIDGSESFARALSRAAALTIIIGISYAGIVAINYCLLHCVASLKRHNLQLSGKNIASRVRQKLQEES